jgi:hypothetical protein
LRRRDPSSAMTSEIRRSCSVIEVMLAVLFIHSCRRITAENIVGLRGRGQSTGHPQWPIVNPKKTCSDVEEGPFSAASP